MTSSEFTDWISYHSSLFPRFEDWFFSETGETDGDRSQVWFESLTEFESHDVKLSSTELLRRPEKKTFAKHLSVLIELCGQEKVQEQYSPEKSKFAHKCGLCGNTGFISVRMNPGLECNTALGNPISEFAAACKCQSGNRYRKNHTPYDSTRMIALVDEGPTRADSEALIQKLRDDGKHGMAKNMENFMNGRTSKVPGMMGAEFNDSAF